MHRTLIPLVCFVLIACSCMPFTALAQIEHGEFATGGLEEEEEQDPQELEDEILDREELLEDVEKAIDASIEGRGMLEGEARWKVKIDAAIRVNYVFANSPDSFVIKYRFTVEGQANADTALIRGNAEINAEVEGFLAKWPTGECRLDVTVPRVPFELTFRRSGEDKGSIALRFRRNIMENWQSKCSFTDAPGARFETIGEPEKWLARALEKARPPLRSIVADITDEETTSSFVINKEILDDPPLGTVEVEGTGIITITPGGLE